MAILTVSRQFGSGGREIAQAVAKALGYELMDKETILKEIRALGHRWEEWAKELDEHSPSVWEMYDWSFRGFGALVQSSILTHAAKDRVVIIGRGGNFLLQGIPHALGIRIVAPMESRLETIMARQSVDQGMARWLAEKIDRERAGFVHALYGKRVDEAKEYDFLFDTGSKPFGEIVGEVVGLLEERDRSKSEASQKELVMRASAARVKAALLTDPAFFLPTLDVEYDGKDIVLRGVVHNPKEHKAVEEAARKLAGSQPLKCHLHYRT